MDITDTTHDQVKLSAQGNSNRQILTSSTAQRTGFTFMRVGDT